jgi:hypothetical protein
MVRRSVVLAALTLASSLASAPLFAADLEFFTGDSLYAQCSAKASDGDFAPRQARCAGYVLGVSDAQQAAQGAGGPGRVCIPAGAGSPQLVDVVTKFLEAHVDKRPLAAQDLVLEALSAQFPCK